METVYKVIWILRKFIIMRDMFNKRQRFSLRKYSFGVASVLLGVSIFSNAQGAQADETVAPTTAGTRGNKEENAHFGRKAYRRSSGQTLRSQAIFQGRSGNPAQMDRRR